MTLEKAPANWKAVSSLAGKLVQRSQCADADTRLSYRTAKILGHETNCHEEEGACSWAKHKILQRRPAKHEGRFSQELIEEIVEIHKQRKVRNVLGPSHRWTKFMIHSETHFRRQHVEPIVHWSNRGTVAIPNSAEFLVAENH